MFLNTALDNSQTHTNPATVNNV